MQSKFGYVWDNRTQTFSTFKSVPLNLANWSSQPHLSGFNNRHHRNLQFYTRVSLSHWRWGPVKSILWPWHGLACQHKENKDNFSKANSRSVYNYESIQCKGYEKNEHWWNGRHSEWDETLNCNHTNHHSHHYVLY